MRREFTTAQKVEIVRRATDTAGTIRCERCGLALKRGQFEIDHIIAEALRPEVDKREKLKIAEGQLLGSVCCHDPKTYGEDIPLAAKAKRREAKKSGVYRKTSRPLPGSKASGLRKKFDGTVERRS
jgi:hypothetical protein